MSFYQEQTDSKTDIYSFAKSFGDL